MEQQSNNPGEFRSMDEVLRDISEQEGDELDELLSIKDLFAPRKGSTLPKVGPAEDDPNDNH